MTSATADKTPFTAVLLAEDDDQDRATLEELRDDAGIEFIDTVEQQRDALAKLRPPVDADLSAEPTRWSYYPWRRAVVRVLGPQSHRRLRLDRNRNLITDDEQHRLAQLRVGVVGLSVGHSIAYTLAAQGVCGELWLADFDELELSNLNRVPGGVFDLSVNKAVATARRIAELDPYLPIKVLTDGITDATVGEFLGSIDLVVEECDSLDAKVLVREHARTRRLPVLMATSDRGMLDIERFDLDASRPLLHGLLGDIGSAALAGLSTKDKVPYVLRILDASGLSPRMAASLVDVGTTLTTWPQLAAEVTLGAALVTEAVRRIGLAEPLASGRVRIDSTAALDHPDDPWTAPTEVGGDESASIDLPKPAPHSDMLDVIAAAAARAPSGGNAQPWQIRVSPRAVEIRLDPTRTAAVDIEFRSSAAAVGASLFNAKVAAAAHGVLGPVDIDEEDGTAPLRAVLHLADGSDQELAALYEAMVTRETNRNLGSQLPIGPDVAEELQSVAHRQSARLRLLTRRTDIEAAAGILAAADRVRYLTPRLHAELVTEIRWPGDPSPDTGLDVRTLGLDREDLAVLSILQRSDVMANLAQWSGGDSLGDYTRDRVSASSALGVVTVRGHTLTDYARGGAAAEAVWIAAQLRGLAVHPVSPLFLNARNDDELRRLSEPFAEALGELQQAFFQLTDSESDESHVLVMRFADAPPTAVRSRRRDHADLRQPVG